VDFVGLIILIVGAYLVDSGVRNRNPLSTLTSIIKNPTQTRAMLASTRGTAYASTPNTVIPVSDGSGNTGGSPGGRNPDTGRRDGTSGSSTGAAALAWARTQIGKPYRWGATGPDTYDCSGLVQQAFSHAGVSVGRTTYQQILVGTSVGRADLQIGDMIFPDVGHVQIYAGNGTVVEAPRTGLNVREAPMWGFLTARRV